MTTHSPNPVCLNCSTPLTGNFCVECGQPASTHRFTLRHIMLHDMIHGLVHLNKGFFFSVKELFTRPGTSTREYVEGKRVNHLNYLSLLVIIILGYSLVEHATPFHYADLSDTDKEVMNSMELLLKDHPKILFIGVIPFYALFSFLFFRKAKQNYAEHFVLNTFKASANLVLNIIFLAIVSFVKSAAVVGGINQALSLIVLGYATFFYYQYFSVFYQNKILLVLRSFLCSLLSTLLVVGIVILYLYKTTGHA